MKDEPIAVAAPFAERAAGTVGKPATECLRRGGLMFIMVVACATGIPRI